MKAKILIVEDDKIVAFNIQSRLEGLEYLVVAVADSGEIALQKVVETCPDLILMDIKLRGSVDGIEVAGQIRKQFPIPIIYLTAYANQETIERAKYTEPYGYILKPFETNNLGTTIEMALYKHKVEQQLRNREQWLTTTLKSIGDAVITTDSNGLVTFMNPVAEALMHLRSEEVIGHNLNQIFHIVDEKTGEVKENPVHLVLTEGITVGLENHTLLITKDGNEIPINDSAAPIKNDAGKILGTVLVFHDASQQQQIKGLLEKNNEELEVKLADNFAQLNEINEELRQEIKKRKYLANELRFALKKQQELNELKSRIIATVSHEYRTPLTTILSSTDILEHYDARLTPDKKKNHFQRIQSSVKYLTKLMEDMLFVHQAEIGHLEFNPISLDVKQVVGELVNEFLSNPTNQHSIIWEYQEICNNISADPNLLKLILRNLLSNSIKFSPKTNPIRLEISAEQSQLVLLVSDEGIGIPAAELSSLFNAFVRGSNIGVTPGVGLGLVIVKECVDLHGGEIGVESEVGKGTTFTVTLPVSQSS